MSNETPKGDSTPAPSAPAPEQPATPVYEKPAPMAVPGPSEKRTDNADPPSSRTRP